jgi:poly(3-hydroxybutyrate) depolymerase
MVFRDSYRDCDAEVLFFRIADGGHTWPNGSPNLTTAGFGVVSRDVDANREMLEFFARHPTSSRSGPRPPASPGHATREIGR